MADHDHGLAVTEYGVTRNEDIGRVGDDNDEPVRSNTRSEGNGRN